MIEEILNAPNELERMLKDQYANYVVQTAMDYADPDTKGRLIEAIRPLLPLVRQTPHGRRIQSKIMQQEGQGRFSGSGTPTDRTSGQIPLGMQLSSGPLTSSYTASMNGYNAINTNFTPSFRGIYPQYTTSAARTNSISHGSGNFMPAVNGGFF